MGDKLEAILLQLPPSVSFGDAQRAEVARIITRMAPVRVAVEFRHRSWVTGPAREATMAMLAERDAAYVCVDAPRTDAVSAMPPLVEVTCPELGYLRLHGRNAETWHGSGSVAERFNYRYSAEELQELVAPVVGIEQARRGRDRRVQQQRRGLCAAQRRRVPAHDHRRPSDLRSDPGRCRRGGRVARRVLSRRRAR